MGAEETFEVDLTTREELERELLAQSDRVARRLMADGIAGATVVVKVKYSDFTLKSRRMKLKEPAFDLDTIFAAAKELLGHFALKGARVRLTGVAVSDLVHGFEPVQGTLFKDPIREKRQKLQKVTADIEAKFGEQGLTRATLLDKE